MKKVTIITLAVCVIAAILKVAWDKYWIYLPGILYRLKNPIGPPQSVEWKKQVVGSRSSIETQPNIILILTDDLGYNGA